MANSIAIGTTAPTMVSAATVAVNPTAGAYSAPASSSVAPAGQYSSALFDTTWKPAVNAQGQSQYDIARTSAETASQRAYQLRSEALQRQLAGQGLDNSGIALRQGQLLNQDTQSTLQSGIAGVNQAELSNAETARQAALGRLYGAEQTGAQIAGQQTIASMNVGSAERIAGMNIASNEKIQTAKDALTSRGIDLQAAGLYGYKDPVTGEWVNGTAQNAATALGLQGRTVEDQEKELWGFTDANGVKHAGKYDLLSDENKRASDSLYGHTDPVTGVHTRGSLENQAMLADATRLNAQTGVDALHGYTDPVTGQHDKGSAEVAQDYFGLKSTELKDQEAELYGSYDPNTGEWLPGKLAQASAADKRAADQLYGYDDPVTGMHVMGTMELQADKNAIERQGMTIQEAQVKGYTDANGVHHPGSSEIAVMQMQTQRDVVELQGAIQNGLLDHQAIIDADKAVQQAQAMRYYTMGKNGEELTPKQLSTLNQNNPLEYESYMDGKAGKTQDEIQRAIDLTNQYRANEILNLDDPALALQIATFYKQWGSEDAAGAWPLLQDAVKKQQAVTRAINYYGPGKLGVIPTNNTRIVS